MKSIGRYSIFPVPLGSQKAYCLVPRSLKCASDQGVSPIGPWECKALAQRKLGRKGSPFPWFPAQNQNSCSCTQLRIRWNEPWDEAGRWSLRSWRNCYFKRLRFWRQGRLAPNFLSAPSNPAGYAGYSRRGEKRNATSIMWIKSFRCSTYSNLKLKMTATFTINNLSTTKIVIAPLHGLSPSLSQQATPHSFIPFSSFMASSSQFFFIASQSLNSLQPRSSVLVLSSLMICRLKQVSFDPLEHSTLFWFCSHCSSVKLSSLRPHW